MMKVTFFKPFYTKDLGDKIRMVFAYQYLAIEHEGKVYNFIPIEAKEIIVDKATLQVENSLEVFVFQHNNRFIRLPLYQLFFKTDISQWLLKEMDQLNLETAATTETTEATEETGTTDKIDPNLKSFIEETILKANRREQLMTLIDDSLVKRDEARFMELTSELKGMIV